MSPARDVQVSSEGLLEADSCDINLICDLRDLAALNPDAIEDLAIEDVRCDNKYDGQPSVARSLKVAIYPPKRH